MSNDTLALLCFLIIAASLMFALCRISEAQRNRRIQYNERLLHRRDDVELGDTDPISTHYNQPTRKHWFTRQPR